MTPDKRLNGQANGKALPDDERQMLDARVLAGEIIPPDVLKAVLCGSPPEGDLKRRYLEQLLYHALHARDAEAAVIVAGMMDSDPALDEALTPILNERLATAPDEVYAFARARLGAGQDSRWMDLLKSAALCALQVAITDGDTETVGNWLRLVAREPVSYELGDVVHQGILAARERARREGDLGRILVPLAVRRDPAALDALLSDEALVAAIPNNLGRVLCEYEGDALLVLQNHGIEMFLVVLARAASAGKGALFTTAAVEQLWGIYTGGQPSGVPLQYGADRIITDISTGGVNWLDEAALQTLLGLALRDHRDDLFYTLARQLVERATFVRLLVTALQRSARPDNDLMALIGQLVAAGDLTPQESVDAYVHLLNGWAWRRTALPVVQQLMRMLHQHPALTVSSEAMWAILEVAAETKDENTARSAKRRLTAELETLEDEGALADALLRLSALTQWNAGLRQNLLVWWRGFVRGGALARLQRLDRALDGKKSLEDLRTILQTVIAFRKMLGKRTLQQFAWDVGVAYGILQAFAESFDPSPKRAVSFDQATIRAELEARAGELSPHEQKIMANNFKELAQLIGVLGDNRSKASLMRRGDDVDRQLMTGDQQPHSAVDTMKWLAGFLSGAQEKDENAEE